MPGPLRTDGTMNEKTYNGWVNYETWTAALCIDQDQSSYHYWREEAIRHRKESPTCQQVRDRIWTVEEAAKFNLADALKEHFHEGTPQVEPVVYSDLLEAALSEVKWSDIAEHLLGDLAEEEHPVFGPVIYAYTRTQAIADGVLVDVSEMAKEAGIVYPTAVTAGVWGEYVRVPPSVEGQDEKGRLWDILNMFYVAARRGLKGDTTLFDVLVKNDNSEPRPVALKAVCSPGDTPDPVITITLPHED